MTRIDVVCLSIGAFAGALLGGASVEGLAWLSAGAMVGVALVAELTAIGDMAGRILVRWLR